MARLTEVEITEALARLPGWSREENVIRRQFTFRSFPDVLAFLVRLGFDAEAADHHPDVMISYRRLTLSYSTHSEGGITAKDITGAREAGALFEAWNARG
jgi:4a-hydroxytetrahydrobiopterin dehydratase